MKKSNFFKRGATGFIVLTIMFLAGSEIFQGQKAAMRINEEMFNYDENDPYIDRPTREALSHVIESTDEDLDIITDANGFDNFEIGIDFAEQMAVTNPINPKNMQFGVNNGTTGQNAYYTTDGYNWTQSNPVYNSSICCDPWSAWDGLGRLVYGSGVSGQYIYRSTTGATYTPSGGTLSVSGNDRNTLAAEQTGTGPYANYFYAAITPGNFARSLDGGVTWTTTYSPSNTIPGTMIAVGPNGATNGGCVMYVTNTGSTQNVTYTFHRSLDGGATFTVRSSLTVAGYVGTLNTQSRLVINNARTRPYPMIAMDNSNGPYRGRLYLVYASNVPAGNGNKPDIRLQYSTDQGATWSAAVTVNDNANPQLSDQWFPSIWCEVTTGRLYIKWYDDRENPATYLTNVYATYSDDGGVSFAPNQKLTTASWTYPNPSCAANTNCYRGDYDAMTANPKAGFAVWYDGRQGTYKNVGSYFPDFGMLTTPASNTIHQTNSSVNYLINIPAVKHYTDVTTFSAVVSPTPATGSIEFEFLGGNTLSSYPNTKYIKVKTVGTVTPVGNYTVTITGEGSNGTPVHKRSVTLTVNTTVGPTPCESFTDVKFPPANFYEDYSGLNFWSRQNPTAYGIGGSGSARFNSWNALGGTVQSIISNNFAATGANTYLTFDNAYRPWTSGFIDSLIIETSTNFGATYTTLQKLWGGLGAQAGPLNTVYTTGGQFTPANKEWASKIFLLPSGTNKIKFKAVSGFGNDIWIDNICVQVLAVAADNSLCAAPEGFYTPLPPSVIQDTIRTYLHRIDFPNIIVDSAISFSTTSGCFNTLYNRALSGSYYITFSQRNSIQTWGTSNAFIYTRGSSKFLDIINDITSVYGSNEKFISPYWFMFSGDVNKDGIIDAADLSLVENGANIALAGYVREDVNGDNYTDASDISIVENNLGESEIAPPGPEPQPELNDNVTVTEFQSEAEREKYVQALKYEAEIKIKNKEIEEMNSKRTELIKKKHSEKRNLQDIQIQNKNSSAKGVN